MSTISLRVSEDEANLIKEYTNANGLNMSSFIRDLVLDKIEDDLNLDEERILNAKQRIDREKAFDHTEVWERLKV
ncbi:type II toxin-antitoxin system RelB family antitoxin [Aminicella lysinilytica]|uniref:Ribbon-helix-helix CopG family protein n=1 Tax=Aminicella lysinilytica TaxID=433323 RepID=A0A4R6PWQ0_9FIRM|nr:DUF6290 family protein [Aminicella lysinilytica]TDP46644.1 hypothetical protein EV211_1589 [Aminicella lysinilytica]